MNQTFETPLYLLHSISSTTIAQQGGDSTPIMSTGSDWEVEIAIPAAPIHQARDHRYSFYGYKDL